MSKTSPAAARMNAVSAPLIIPPSLLITLLLKIFHNCNKGEKNNQAAARLFPKLSNIECEPDAEQKTSSRVSMQAALLLGKRASKKAALLYSLLKKEKQHIDFYYQKKCQKLKMRTTCSIHNKKLGFIIKNKLPERYILVTIEDRIHKNVFLLAFTHVI